LVISQRESPIKSKKHSREFFRDNQQGRHDNSRKQDNPTNDENSNESEDQDIDPNQDFIKKGYSDKDIQELTG